MDYNDMVDYIVCCKLVQAHCPNGYARNYAIAGQHMRDQEFIKVQCLYILSNIGSWRGPVAKRCREVFKRVAGRAGV